MPAAELERDFQSAVIEAARALGWTVAHFRPARTGHGWRTPVQADGKGFPDLCLVRDRVLFVELKRDKGKLTREQAAWVTKLRWAGAEVYVWRPDDWEDAVRVLKRSELET
jgi:hypothetical protein